MFATAALPLSALLSPRRKVWHFCPASNLGDRIFAVSKNSIQPGEEGEVMAEIDERELTRVHNRARLIVQSLITLSLLLVVLAFAGVRFSPPQSLLDPNVYRALWIVIIFLGLGAVVLRRVRTNAARLQDIAGLWGQSALLASLLKTTLFVAALGFSAAVLGYFAHLLTRDPVDALRAGVVAVAVLIYGYPRRAAWRRALEASQQSGAAPGPEPAKGSTA